jgi:hypothetical protein
MSKPCADALRIRHSGPRVRPTVPREKASSHPYMHTLLHKVAAWRGPAAQPLLRPGPPVDVGALTLLHSPTPSLSRCSSGSGSEPSAASSESRPTAELPRELAPSPRSNVPQSSCTLIEQPEAEASECVPVEAGESRCALCRSRTVLSHELGGTACPRSDRSDWLGSGGPLARAWEG